ncbi:MAG: class I SAM-dependent methyltransferase [Dermatophilaceae bacterium]|nr:class I SAM-dependent methyltransferase [Dermatophilaceae bacterium]
MTDDIYDHIGNDYTQGRRPDPRWQAALDDVLGQPRTLLNVGAGTGSYEPRDRYVLAVEPSKLMISQRPAAAAPALQASAESLPVADKQFDAAMALVTIHHWQDWRAGLREMQRVARRVIVLHFDPDIHSAFWLVRDYLPTLADVWREVPSVQEVATHLGPGVEVRDLPVPWDCVDGFLPAYWRRPEAYLDPQVRQSMSGLRFLDPDELTQGIEQLRSDLRDGTWRRRNRQLLKADALDVGWRLIAFPT